MSACDAWSMAAQRHQGPLGNHQGWCDLQDVLIMTGDLMSIACSPINRNSHRLREEDMVDLCIKVQVYGYTKEGGPEFNPD